MESFCSMLEEKMNAMRYFYKTSTMTVDGILTLFNDDFASDLLACQVKLDQRLFDFLIELDTGMSCELLCVIKHCSLCMWLKSFLVHVLLSSKTCELVSSVQVIYLCRWCDPSQADKEKCIGFRVELGQVERSYPWNWYVRKDFTWVRAGLALLWGIVSSTLDRDLRCF